MGTRRRIIAAGIASALLAGSSLALPGAAAEAAKLKDFRVAYRGEKVVATWTFCTARRVRTWQQLDIWGTSAVTETERILWEPRPTYPRGCQRRRKAFPYLVIAGPYAAQLTIKVRGGRLHQSRVKHFRVE
jgi:hypothetical protein